MRLIPKNWNEFQQYKDRKPSWIKLHRDLLNDFSYSSVQIGTKATLPLLWLLACEYDDGIIDASIEEISFRIHIDKSTVDEAIKELVKFKFFTLVQDCTEVYELVPREEKRRDREEIEKDKSKEVVIIPSIDYNLPLGTDKDLFNDFLLMRKKLKAPNTQRSINSLISRLTEIMSKGFNPNDIIQTSYDNGWKSFFEPKQQSKQPMKSFKQQDKEAIDSSIDNYYRMKEQGFNLQEELIKQAELEKKGNTYELN